MFGGLGAHWGGSWGHISEQNGGLEDTGGRHGGSGGTWRGPEGQKYQFWLPFWDHLGAKMGVKSDQTTVPKNNGHFYVILIAPGAQ